MTLFPRPSTRCITVRDDVPSEATAETRQREFSALIQSARSGCDEAIGELIRQCRPYLLAIANAEIDPDVAAKVGASDIVQNSMLSAQRCIGDFEGESREQLLVWLKGILAKDLQQTRRYFHAEKRHVGREQSLGDDSLGRERSRLVDQLDSPSKAVSLREQEELLHQAMASLTDDERLVIELRNWQRLSFVEIGARLNRSADAVRKLWSRAIVRLQNGMNDRDK